MSTYFDTLDKTYYKALRENTLPLSPDKLTKDVILRARKVALDIINNYSNNKEVIGSRISFDELLRRTSFCYFNLGLEDVAYRCVSILKDMDFYTFDGVDSSSFVVSSMLDDTGAHVAKKAVNVLIPEIVSDNSVYFLVHEIAHIIKEEYSLECKGLFTNLEMIPILLELISASKENNYEIFNRRQILLMHEAINFLKLLKDMKNICKEEFDIYMTALGSSAVYLNSFYYTMVLYKLYLEKPNYVINIINQVLNGTKSSNDVINYLDNEYICDTEYSEGLDVFKNIVNKK